MWEFLIECNVYFNYWYLCSFKGAIKSLAREISSDDGTAEKWIVGVKEQQRARLLVEFVEFLEKATYNASEGCATAMVPPPKVFV